MTKDKIRKDEPSAEAIRAVHQIVGALSTEQLHSRADREKRMAGIIDEEFTELRAALRDACACLNAAIRLCRMDTGPYRPDESIKLWEETMKKGMALLAGTREPGQ